MEIESKQIGSKINIQNPKSPIKFGRQLNFSTTDRTVSRHHITFNFNPKKKTVNFIVYGKNPLFVLTNDDEIKVYKKGEKGELHVGDWFCVCSKSLVWFKLKESGEESLEGDWEFGESLGGGFDEIESGGGDYGDVGSGGGDGLDDDIDPVKEFNFVVIGHEFDSYPRKLIRDIKNWDWFLEENNEADGDEEDVSDTKAKKGKRRKRKKGGGNDDEDDDVWTGESDEDVELIKKLKNDQKPKYSTRSKDQKKNKNGASTSRGGNDTTKSYAMDDEDEDEDDDENDETLGGFIVDDEDVGEGNDDDDDEEEFDDDEDDE